MLNQPLHYSAQFYKNVERFLIFTFVSWLVWCIFFSERIPENNGIGWDGTYYAALAQHFMQLVFHHKLTIYSLQRIFPSSIIFLVAKLLHYSLTNDKMPFVFSIYNTAILSIAVLTWNAIANYLKWKPEVRLITFAGLFMNYAILKMTGYYPILTDFSAFVCGLLMLYFFLTQKTYSLLLTTLVGAFIFPTLLTVGLILFIFSKSKYETLSSYSQSDKKAWIIATVISFLLAFAITTFCFFYYNLLGGPIDAYSLGRNTTPSVFYTSICLLFGFFFLAFRPVCYRLNIFIPFIFKQAFTYRLVIAILLMLCLKIIIWILSSGEEGALSPLTFLQLLTIRSLSYPAIHLVSHFVYYGPIVFLFIYFWKEIIAHFQNKSLGLFIITAFYIIISIDTESRQIINFLPIAVIGVGEILNKKIITRNFILVFLVLSFVTSKVWLPLNHGWQSLLTNYPVVTLDFPLQWFFMSQGPWMSQFAYLIYLPTAIITFGILFALIKYSLKKEGNRV